MTPADRREYSAALVLGAAGAGVILLALRQVWAHAVYTPPHPLPAQNFGVSGQSLVPLASGLAIAALACLAAVIATRGVLRRATGVLLAVIGLGAAVAAAAAVTSGAVLSAATSADPTAGVFSGSMANGAYSSALGIVGLASGHAVITGLPWRVAAIAGALAIVLAGLAAAWRGTRWPVMSARFERPGQRPAGLAGSAGPAGSAGSAGSVRNATDSATIWESLSRGVDPTDGDPDGPDEVDFGPGGG